MSLLSEDFISADGHVVEPADLFITRMDKRFRDRAPRIDSRPDGDYFVVDGLAPVAVGLGGAAMEDKIRGAVKSRTGYRYADTRPGAWDPKARLADQKLDHLAAEVIYPGMGLLIPSAKDPDYQAECARVYNGWLAEFCAGAPGRLIGVGMLPLRCPVDTVLKHAENAAKLGLRSVAIPMELERPYHVEELRGLWEGLQDLGLPVALHTGTSGAESLTQMEDRLDWGGLLAEVRMGSTMRSLSSIIWGAVPQRFPKLRFVMVETSIGWIASLLTFLDHWWTFHHEWIEPRLNEPPSFYFHRQFWATFEEDRAGILTRELLNVDHLMWGSDYPHTEGTFPESQKQVASTFAGVGAIETAKMVRENAAALYGLKS
jgi:predicted TIM-barrel fold metal-dependent hydrolase